MRHRFIAMIEGMDPAPEYGSIRKIAPGQFQATGPDCAIGQLCHVGDEGMLAEVAAVDTDGIVLVPVVDSMPVRLGARVTAMRGGDTIVVGDAFAGRAIDALGRPIDGGKTLSTTVTMPIRGRIPGPLDRMAPARILETGVRAIDAMLTLGEGQRIGIFAASGVGKTSLIEQLAASVPATRCILCLVGERGREVESLWRSVASRSDSTRYTLVAATSDESAAMRSRSVAVALCLAEYWRDRGDHVVLIIDSVTRYAMALREIGLAAGEPPTVRAYTPNVFAALPRIVERCGAVRDGGAITAIMTVLSETDSVDDPIVETMKSLLDGHIVLSRSLAERGHFPAIDVPRSVSRQASRLITRTHAEDARAVASQLGVYDESRIMIESGIYVAGTTPEIDVAIERRAAVLAFLQQPADVVSPLADTLLALNRLSGAPHG